MRENPQPQGPQGTFAGSLRALAREMAQTTPAVNNLSDGYTASLSYRDIDARGNEAREALCRRFSASP